MRSIISIFLWFHLCRLQTSPVCDSVCLPQENDQISLVIDISWHRADFLLLTHVLQWRRHRLPLLRSVFILLRYVSSSAGWSSASTLTPTAIHFRLLTYPGFDWILTNISQPLLDCVAHHRDSVSHRLSVAFFRIVTGCIGRH